MTPNVSFALLDAAVIAGRGEQPAVAGWTHARLLEEVAAIGGVLRHLGVGPGVPTLIRLADDVDAIVAALATARVGGVGGPPTTRGCRSCSPTTEQGCRRTGDCVLVRGGDVAAPDLDWAVMLRAGRTDPAACEVMEPGCGVLPGADAWPSRSPSSRPRGRRTSRPRCAPCCRSRLGESIRRERTRNEHAPRRPGRHRVGARTSSSSGGSGCDSTDGSDLRGRGPGDG